MSKKKRPKKQETLVTVETLTREHGEELMLQPMGEPCGLNRRIREPTVNRPGLALVGYKKYFASKRVQVFGSVETTYLRSLTPKEREDRSAFCSSGSLHTRLQDTLDHDAFHQLGNPCPGNDVCSPKK